MSANTMNGWLVFFFMVISRAGTAWSLHGGGAIRLRLYGENVILLRALARRCLAWFDDLHCEDDAELGLAAGHAGVGFIDLVEGEFLDHRADAG